MAKIKHTRNENGQNFTHQNKTTLFWRKKAKINLHQNFPDLRYRFDCICKAKLNHGHLGFLIALIQTIYIYGGTLYDSSSINCRFWELSNRVFC